MILVAITGASGIAYSIKLLELLKEQKIETELIISKTARKIIKKEANIQIEEIVSLSAKEYDVNDLFAAPSSGSYKFDSMIIIPCSMKTLSAISNGYTDNLISRSADVAIKEGRKLVLVVRETPFNAIHLKNMLRLSKIGVKIMPPIPSFYTKPKTIDDLLTHTIGRILDQIGIRIHMKRWNDDSN